MEKEKMFDPSASYVAVTGAGKSERLRGFFYVFLTMLFAFLAILTVLINAGLINNPLDNAGQVAIVLQEPKEAEPDIYTSEPNIEAPRFLEISLPEEGDTVNGQIGVSGSAAALFGSIETKLYSSSGVELGKTRSALRGLDEDRRPWAGFLDLAQSPQTPTGYLQIFPAGMEGDPQLSKRIPIIFESRSSDRGIQFYAPVAEQKLTESTVIFRGSSTLFSGEIRLILRDEEGVEIYSGTRLIEANGEFDFSLLLSGLNQSLSSAGEWEVFSGEELLLTIPVRLK